VSAGFVFAILILGFGLKEIKMNWNLIDKTTRALDVVWLIMPIVAVVLIFVPGFLLAYPQVDLPQSQKVSIAYVGYNLLRLIVSLKTPLWIIAFYFPFVLAPLNLLMVGRSIKEKNSDKIVGYVIISILLVLMLIYRTQIMSALS